MRTLIVALYVASGCVTLFGLTAGVWGAADTADVAGTVRWCRQGVECAWLVAPP